MSLTHFGLVSALALAVVFACGAGGAGEAVEAYTVGGARVWAIADSLGERDMTVFGDADPELLKKIAPTGASPSSIMTFVLEMGGEYVLLDAGLGNPPSSDRASMLMNGLAKAGVPPENIRQVLITHMHGDHIGGLIWEGKRAFPNAVVRIGRVEHDFWLADASRAEYPTRQANFDLARKVVDMYADRVETFEFGDTVIPGVKAIDSVGHTPGHTAFLIESGGGKLLCVGDLLHAAALQFPHPGINSRYDMIPEKTVASRVRILDLAAREKLPIAGMHLPFSGIGRVEKDGDGFRYLPGL